MIDLLKKLFGFGPPVDFANLIKQGATLVDVRTPGEYATGHIKGSVNIPLQQLETRLTKIPVHRPVITCCASGMRSASAMKILKSHGYSEVYNGGGWISLQNKIR